MNSSTTKLKFFGERLREARKAAGMTQDALAIFLDKKPATISNWESGKENFPDVHTLITIAERFNLTVGQLLGEKEIPARGNTLELTIREIVREEIAKNLKREDLVVETAESGFDVDLSTDKPPPESDESRSHKRLQSGLVHPATTAKSGHKNEGLK